ncbi:MAG TPA: amidohydrolase family protein [Burkholderiales bacterium]|nr:amidohydrolase family protein [Burkholderiales bacterium]
MQTPNIPPPVHDTRAPKIKFPPKACDCHAHIFGPQSRYRLLPKTHFVPHENPLSDYVRMLRTLGCERGVLVQPSVYGTDNTLIAEALQSGEFALRGVAVVAPDVSDRELEHLHAAGFRGIRINTASATPGLKITDAPRLAARIKPLGWHLQFFANLRDMPQLEEQLATLPVNIVIDHFGCIAAADGLDAPPFQALLRLLRREHCWAKLMGPYFASEMFPQYPDLVPFAQALVQAAPDRVVWGSDWPHPSARAKMPNDGDLADMLPDWVPDEAQRRKLLVDNPRRLYSFD